MTSEIQPEPRFDPVGFRVVYLLVAFVCVGLTIDMSFTHKVFGAPELSPNSAVIEARYRFVSALLIVEAGIALIWYVVDSRRRDRPAFVVNRSRLRLWAFAALAIPAVFMAIDLTRTHHFAPEPEASTEVVGQETNSAGETVDVTVRTLTDVGRTEQRRDAFFGVALFVGGLAALGFAAKELALPTPFLIADDEGLLIRVDGPGNPPRRFRWEGIVEVRSSLLDDDGEEIPVLSIRLLDIEEVPYLPAGARAEPPWLHVYADEWEVSAHQIAPFLDQRAARPRPAGEYE